MNLEQIRQSKTYDLLMGLPLILWFGIGVVKLRPDLVLYARALADEPFNPVFSLRLFALLATVSFNLLLIYLVLARDSPVLRSKGLMPRLVGFAGTFLGVGILHLRPAALTLGWQGAADALILTGGLGSVVALAWLGKGFSIMPEARLLVTRGPYAWARHPLYAAEIVTLTGIVIAFQQPWAALLALAVVMLLFARTIYEERVLTRAFPEYAAYRVRVKRFGFI
jgi:protein-S-isoprenylcysteine O-methyltransferase Ste14